MMSILFLSVITFSLINNKPKDNTITVVQDQIKSSAYKVLQDKCNICHVSKKQIEDFTRENMDSLAPNIWKQVFLKKKMPKGRKIKLDEEEYKTLRTWLDLTLEKKD